MPGFHKLHFGGLRPICSLVRAAAFFLVLSAASAAEPAVTQRASVGSMQASLQVQRESAARMRALSLSRRPPGPRGPMAPVRPQAQLAAGAGCVPLPAGEVEALAAQAGAREGVDASLLRAVIETESAALPCAVSRKGAMGLMQLMPVTALELAVENPFDPKENVDAGARFLKRLLVRYGGDLALVLGAYNAGPSRVDAAGGVPGIPETVDYVGRVLSRLGVTAAKF